MSMKMSRRIPGNIPSGIIRNQHLDLSNLAQRIQANELFECSLTGEASKLYGDLGPNLISCKLDNVTFPTGVSHFDAKDTLFMRTMIRHRFDRILITQCAFREVSFEASTFNDTVFVDSTFEGVQFFDCDFSVTTFKSNVFRGCSFLRCKTTNKLFEHCLFYHCKFSQLRLQEGSILQNYGIQLLDAVDLSIYRAETGEELTFDLMVPKTRLERISLAYFYDLNLNESRDLHETVQLNLEDATRTNILYMVTGIRQLTSFLLFLFEEGKLLLFFPLQLFWSLDKLLNSQHPDELPLSVLETLEVSLTRLRRLYEEVYLSIPPSESCYLLVHEDCSEAELKTIFDELDLNLVIRKFQPFNSPSIAEITSPDTLDLVLFVTLFLSTRFRAEVDRYQAHRKLLDIGTRLIGDGTSNLPAAFQALVALNVPRLLYVRLSARVSLALLSRLRTMVLKLFDDATSVHGSAPEVTEGQQGSDLITLLFLAANPQNSPRLQLDHEIRGIDQALTASGVRTRFRVEQAWAISEREMQDSLLRYDPDIVHLSAHGALSGKPLLDREASRAATRHPLDNKRRRDLAKGTGSAPPTDEAIGGLAKLFEIAGRHVRCLVLNTCHSAAAAVKIAPYVGCVIGMTESISDDAAIQFSWALYNSLAYGNDVEASFELAVAQLAIGGRKESHIPKLFPGMSDPKSIVLIKGHRRHRYR